MILLQLLNLINYRIEKNRCRLCTNVEICNLYKYFHYLNVCVNLFNYCIKKHVKYAILTLYSTIYSCCCIFLIQQYYLLVWVVGFFYIHSYVIMISHIILDPKRYDSLEQLMICFIIIWNRILCMLAYCNKFTYPEARRTIRLGFLLRGVFWWNFLHLLIYLRVLILQVDQIQYIQPCLSVCSFQSSLLSPHLHHFPSLEFATKVAP